MAKKRLSIDIDEKLHAALKSESSALGIALGPFCEEILEKRESSGSQLSIEREAIPMLRLDELRELAMKLADNKPKDWKNTLGVVNLEIRRRYRVR